MKDLKAINLLNQIGLLKTEAYNLIHEMDTKDWHYSESSGKWSICEHFAHLILSGIPIAGLFKQPDDFFRSFGNPPEKQRNYQELYDDYQKILATGMKAPSAFDPEAEDRKDIKTTLESWNQLIDKLLDRVERQWTADRLDRFQLPHPALGLITPREMLFFKHFHTLHHYKAIKKMKKNFQK